MGFWNENSCLNCNKEADLPWCAFSFQLSRIDNVQDYVRNTYCTTIKCSTEMRNYIWWCRYSKAMGPYLYKEPYKKMVVTICLLKKIKKTPMLMRIGWWIEKSWPKNVIFDIGFAVYRREVEVVTTCEREYWLILIRERRCYSFQIGLIGPLIFNYTQIGP